MAMLRPREAVGRVELVDARSDDPRVAAAIADGLDPDAGMVAIWQGRQFFGEDAVHLLATLSAPGGVMNGLQRRILASPRRAALIYPLLARGRRLYLRPAGRPSITDRGTAPPPGDEVFGPGIWRIGSTMTLSGSVVQTLQMYSQGVRPQRVWSLRAQLQAAMTSARCVRN